MKPLLIAAMTILSLAACSGNGGDQQAGANGANASAEAAPAGTTTAMTGDVGIQPGLWETRATLEEVEMPGAPPAALEQMKAQIAGRTEQVCFTPEDAANMGRRMFETNGQGNDCTFARQTFAGGQIDVAGTCRGQGSTAEMTMQGSFTPTTMLARNEIRTTTQGTTVRMVVSSNAQRVGECPAGGAAKS